MASCDHHLQLRGQSQRLLIHTLLTHCDPLMRIWRFVRLNEMNRLPGEFSILIAQYRVGSPIAPSFQPLPTMRSA